MTIALRSAQRLPALWLIALTLAFSAQASPTRLLLIGGGAHPAEVMSRFVNEAGGAEAHILVVTWATDFPADAMNDVVGELTSVHGASATEAPRPPFDATSRDLFLRALKSSTGVYFTGGDQTKIMSVIADPAIREALVTFYNDGGLVAGTSAGTAIMSPYIFVGHESDVAPGLDLLPGTLLDTHFLVRQRLPRLRAALQDKPQLTGLGIDQDNAIWVTGGKHVETFGPTVLTLVTTDPVAGHGGLQVIRTVGPGREFDLP